MVSTIDNFELTLEFQHPINAYALVIGGYFPLPLAIGDLLLVDRNIFNAVTNTGEKHRHDTEATQWWISFLNRPEVTINPVLCALEGTGRSVPTYDEFYTSFDGACEAITHHLPMAKLVTFSSNSHYEAAYSMIRGTALRYENEKAFLMSVSPLLANRNSASMLRRIESKILDLCSDHKVSAFSFPTLAALSCLYETRDGTGQLIGRRVIKPSKPYLQEQAHNTLSDLRALELLALSNGLGLGRFAFCTQDKGLAALWCALKPEAARWETNTARVKFQLEERLFPCLDKNEVDELGQRLIKHDSTY